MTIEVTAKKVDEAIKQGLEQLGVTIDKVDVEILESGGLFRKAKVRLTLVEEPAPESKSAPESKPAPQQSAKPKQDQAPQQSVAPKKQPKQARPEAPTDGAGSPENKPAAQKQNRPQKQKQQKPQQPQQSEKRAEQSAADGEVERTPRTPDPAVTEQAVSFITELVAKMGFEGVTVTATESGDVDIQAQAGDDSLLIGRHGETLSAMSFLAETLARAEKRHANITVDCNGYRERRAASLTAMAKRRADECVAKHRKIKLEAMERVDRRTIHNALTSDTRVTTASEGKEPHRYVVILPKRQ